jgi:hypothetical protein
MSTRNGKIARLPQHVRTQLNRRMQDGQQGEPLLTWLNGLPETLEVLKEFFDGAPINKQSLSQWRLGGYEEWLKHEEAREELQQLAEEAADFRLEAEEQPVSELVGTWLSVELARAAKTMLAEATDAKERWRVLRELLGELASLRRQDHRTARLRLAQERWEMEQERLMKEEVEKEVQAERIQALKEQYGLPTLAEISQRLDEKEAELERRKAELKCRSEKLSPAGKAALVRLGQSGSDRGREGKAEGGKAETLNSESK